MAQSPAEIAVVNDYEVVVRGVAAMLAPYADRVRVVELDLNRPPTRPLDIALFDTFASPQEGDEGDMLAALERSPARRLVVYSWRVEPWTVHRALDAGASGYLSKALTGPQLVDQLVRIHHGEVVTTPHPGGDRPADRSNGAGGRSWPGRELGLTERESEVLALAAQGCDNTAIARHLYLSPNSVKTHARNLYRKIGVTNRTQAVLWGIAHGFLPDRGAIRPVPPGGGPASGGGAVAAPPGTAQDEAGMRSGRPGS
ncbi:MAG: response regulator transcription factor [Acidimicrobiales bacterium]